MATLEYQRFSLESVNAGLPSGWTFASGWYPFQASWWAWYRREPSDG